ncbi:MAG: helix-turn-helix domain-containing protein [Janibacter sp.]
MSRTRTNGIARALLAANEAELAQLIPRLVEEVAKELALPPVPPDHKWPADLLEVTREFLTCVAMDDLDRIREPGSLFEQVGRESARGGIDPVHLSAGIRLAARRTQAQVYRAAIAEGSAHDTEIVLELLGRVVAAGEAVVTAAHRGYEMTGVAGDDEDDVVRQLAGALIYGHSHHTELVRAAGWERGTLVCAILASADSAADIRRTSDLRVAYFPREHDVVLIHPVGEGRLATTLRPLLKDHACAVGPAVRLSELPSSLGLAQRAAGLTRPGQDAVFADDVLLELACSADPAVVAALRRKYFGELDALPSDQRELLTDTLREWLLQWGHRPGIAGTLKVHPQTVSGRVNRLKDLLCDDLEDPGVRSELLVLLIADSAGDASAAALRAGRDRGRLRDPVRRKGVGEDE